MIYTPNNDDKTYLQVTLRHIDEKTEVVSWIESYAAKLGTTMVLKGKTGRWEVIATTEKTMTGKELRYLQSSRKSFRDRKEKTFWGENDYSWW